MLMKRITGSGKTIWIDGLNGGWISVKDKLPENNVAVLAYCEKTKKYFVGNTIHHYWRHEGAKGAMYTVTSKVTHWMPLPEPPKEE